MGDTIMPSTINAKNTSTGVVITPDASGQLELQTADTTRMTIDVNGNVGIGTTSPAFPLDVNKAGGGAIRSGNGFNWYNSDNTNNYYIYNAGSTGSSNANLLFVQGGVAERIRIDSSGNVGINNNSPVQKLDVGVNYVANPTTPTGIRVSMQPSGLNPDQYGLRMYVGVTSTGSPYNQIMAAKDVNGYLAFTTGASDTERMRIDSSGNLLIGRTNNPSGFTSGLYVTGAYSTTTPSGANVFINTDGSFFRSTSSIKYKTNVENYAKGLDDLSKLRPVTYQAKEGINTEQVFAGFVAEEVHEVGLTEFVQYAEDGTPDALSYGNMVALCVKAIQELKAELDTVKAELATLKGEPS